MGTEIVFETHALSEDNERGVASGWLDPALSSRGRDLAEALGRRRRNDGIAAAFTSDLRRAVETASIALAGSSIELHIDRRLRECNYGQLNGSPLADLSPRSRFIDAPFPEGESYRGVVARVADFVRQLAPFEGRRVLIVGHSATRWALEHLLNGVPLERLVDAREEWREGWTYRTRDRPAR